MIWRRGALTDRVDAPITRGVEIVAPSVKHWPCERCKGWVLPVKPHWGWRVAEVSFWLSVPGALMVMKGLGVIVMPLLFVFAGGLAGPLRSLAGAEPRCPTCRCYLTAPKRSAA